MRLFQYAILFKGKKNNDREWTERPSVVKDVASILAADEQTALMMVAREIPKEYAEKMDLVDIAIRPF